jgi:hypothetical protein
VSGLLLLQKRVGVIVARVEIARSARIRAGVRQRSIAKNSYVS